MHHSPSAFATIRNDPAAAIAARRGLACWRAIAARSSETQETLL
jgi:hypothetical protein